MSAQEKLTPMMKQFMELKQQYSDCMLLFRAGDFYETFYDDAKTCAKVLNITLTKRGGVPMAGVPFHSINPYIKKLLENNYKVALCEQLEDPKKAKGLVKRGVTRIITPGTILEDEYLSSAENNFIMCVYAPKNISEKYGVSVVDITTGEFLTSQLTKFEDLKTLIRKYSPNEIILNESSFVRGLKQFIENANIYYNFLSDMRFNFTYANEILKKQFGYKSEELGLESKDYATIASGALLFYIYKLQKLDLSHIHKLEVVNLSSHMLLDSISLRNLEITESIFSKDKSKTLYGILNNTKTAGGARLLKKHLISPLLQEKEINNRLDAIDELNEFVIERNEIRELLDEVFDIERITSRISSEIASPKDLFALRISLEKLPEIKKLMQMFVSDDLKKIKKLDSFPEITELLQKSIVEDAPAHTRDIGYIKKDFNDELKNLFELAFNSKDYIRDLEESERLRSGISKLKIKFNRIFGYYIEVPRTQESKVPQDYQTKQTLVNAIRFTKPELKEKEQEILGAEEKIRVVEKELFEEIISKLKSYIRKFQKLSYQLALLDVYCSNSLSSQLYKFTRPEFSQEENQIMEGRNPLVERFVDDFIPNDIFFDKTETFKIVTGPNMAGKSTYLRQAALISVMAQAGLFIPAKKSTIKIYDRIFTRIGAHDELVEGQSTFMVEMSETANILNNATKNSLVLLDEIGRGTSTYDGLAIAWAVTEHLTLIGCDSIFATHYHQLNELSQNYQTIQNYNVHIREEGEKIIFLHKIIKGGTDKSFGVYVAKLAGVPQTVLDRAKEVQKNIEDNEEITIKQEYKKKSSKKTQTQQSSKGLGDFL